MLVTFLGVAALGLARAQHPPAWVLDAAPASGGGKCSSALDCNAEKCYDCSCGDNACACADGYAGPHCEVAFCSNRTHGCSGHGECQQTLHDVKCVCDKYFSGPHCEVAQCQLDCKHGGAPNKGCTACEGCKGAWSGKLCQVWDQSVPHSQLMTQLGEIVKASQKMLDEQAKLNPICKQGRECVGWGVDGITGKPTPFPVVWLSYDPSRADKKFNGMSEPLEVIANHVVDPVWASVDEAQSFARVEEFVQHVNSAYQGATPAPKGTSGIYSRGFSSVFQEYFQKADDRALSVVRASQSYISMNLPVDPTTHTRQYHFDRHADEFINALPATYESENDKAQFRKFIENWGTSFATSATLGGRVEQYSSWKTWLTDSRMGGFDKPKLAHNAKIDFYAKTGLPGSSGAEHDPGYGGSSVTVEALNCQGGDPSVSCTSNFEKWAATLKDAPILLDYELAPISDLVSDPEVKKSLEAAVREYVAEQKASWAKLNKCPPTCNGAGSCDGSSCACKYNGRVGRMCSGCAPMSVRGTFTDIYGKTHSGTSTLSCNGKMEAVWSGGVTCQTVELFKEITCNTQARAICARTSAGNLIARVEEDACSYEDYKFEEKDASFRRRLLSSRHGTGRRLLNMRGSVGEALHKKGKPGCFGSWKEQSSPSSSVTGSSAHASFSSDKRSGCTSSKKKFKECKVTAVCEFV